MGLIACQRSRWGGAAARPKDLGQQLVPKYRQTKKVETARSPSTGEWINRWWLICMRDDCAVIRNRLVLTPSTRVSLSDVVRVKEARYKRTKYLTIPPTGGSKRGQTSEQWLPLGSGSGRGHWPGRGYDRTFWGWWECSISQRGEGVGLHVCIHTCKVYAFGKTH